MTNVFIIIFLLFVHSSVLQDKFQKERDSMVKTQIENRGIKDKSVLNAMKKVLRHEMVPSNVVNRSYTDGPLPIGYGQTISQPYIVAYMTEAIKPKPEHKVLEIGTGSGYQAAVLSQLARRVYTVERHRHLVAQARAVFDRLGLTNITALAWDGCYGLPEQAPFDRILVTAAAEDPPGPLLEQLRVGGIMVLPVGQSDAVQSLIRVRRTETGFDYDELRPVRFVPLIEGMARE